MVTHLKQKKNTQLLENQFKNSSSYLHVNKKKKKLFKSFESFRFAKIKNCVFNAAVLVIARQKSFFILLPENNI